MKKSFGFFFLKSNFTLHFYMIFYNPSWNDTVLTKHTKWPSYISAVIKMSTELDSKHFKVVQQLNFDSLSVWMMLGLKKTSTFCCHWLKCYGEVLQWLSPNLKTLANGTVAQRLALSPHSSRIPWWLDAVILTNHRHPSVWVNRAEQLMVSSQHVQLPCDDVWTGVTGFICFKYDYGP